VVPATAGILARWGRKGLLEKDLVLDIVERLGKLVEEKPSAEVIYTRQDDCYLPSKSGPQQTDMCVSCCVRFGV